MPIANTGYRTAKMTSCHISKLASQTCVYLRRIRRFEDFASDVKVPSPRRRFQSRLDLHKEQIVWNRWLHESQERGKSNRVVHVGIEGLVRAVSVG